MAAPRSAAPKTISVPELQIRSMEFTIVGDAPLVIHAWSAKAIKKIQDSQSGKPRQGGKKSEPRNPDEEWRAAMYLCDDGQPGLPARCIKAAMVECSGDVGAYKTVMKRAFHVLGDILPIEGSEPFMHTAMVRTESGTAMPAYRPMWEKWRVRVQVRYNAAIISPAHLINLARTAGFGAGICEGRPSSKEGIGMGWGTFTVEAAEWDEDAREGLAEATAKPPTTPKPKTGKAVQA